jgi:hypothetical protein
MTRLQWLADNIGVYLYGRAVFGAQASHKPPNVLLIMSDQ